MDNAKAAIDKSNVAGIVLAGGRSSRMGRDKALIEFNGTPLLDRSVKLLSGYGVRDVKVSGNYAGYNCIPDPQAHIGPAAALAHILQALHSDSLYDYVLALAVDMPYIDSKILDDLLEHPEGAYFNGKHFPALLPVRQIKSDFKNEAVLALYDSLALKSLSILSYGPDTFKNLNSPQDV